MQNACFFSPSGVRLIWPLLLCSVVAVSAAKPKRPTWTLVSPDTNVVMTVIQDRLGPPYSTNELNLYFCVQLKGKTVIEDSPLGAQMEGTNGNFVQDLRFTKQGYRNIDESYQLPSGKRRVYANHAAETSLSFRNTNGLGMDLIVRVYNDGVAYRYMFLGAGDRSITNEVSGFRLPLGSTGWGVPWVPNYEGLFRKGEVGKDFFPSGDIQYPVLFKTPGGAWALLTEAAVYGDYCATHLGANRAADGLFKIALAQDGAVTNSLPWLTPWRVVIMGATLQPLVETIMPENLNPPSEIRDPSWIRPGIAASLRWYAPNDAKAAADFEDAHGNEFVDFAHEMGWAYYQRTAIPPAVLDYLKTRNMAGWDYFDWSNTELTKGTTMADVDRMLAERAQRGIVGLKCDFMDSDTQQRMQDYDAIARLCLKHKQMINWHGATVPRGQRRRWPHMIAYEAVLGAEYYKSSNGPTPVHQCMLPFTRNVVGSMDFAGVTFSAAGRQNTDAHELALSVVYECGIQTWGGAPEVYRKIPAAMDFLKKVPAAWDEIRFIDGYPGEWVVLARRQSTNWFMGALSAGPARDLTVPLAFLGTNCTYRLELHKDGAAKTAIDTDKQEVTSQSTLRVRLLENGGFCGALFFDQTNAPARIKPKKR